jgi:HMG (high mobility group) box
MPAVRQIYGWQPSNEDHNEVQELFDSQQFRKLRKNSDPGWVPRPRNAFIIFRCDYVKQHSASSSSHSPFPPSDKSLSKRAAEAWKQLPQSEQDRYKLLAIQEKKEHGERYPNYKFRPAKRRGSLARSNPDQDLADQLSSFKFGMPPTDVNQSSSQSYEPPQNPRCPPSCPLPRQLVYAVDSPFASTSDPPVYPLEDHYIHQEPDTIYAPSPTNYYDQNAVMTQMNTTYSFPTQQQQPQPMPWEDYHPDIRDEQQAFELEYLHSNVMRAQPRDGVFYPHQTATNEYDRRPSLPTSFPSSCPPNTNPIVPRHNSIDGAMQAPFAFALPYPLTPPDRPDQPSEIGSPLFLNPDSDFYYTHYGNYRMSNPETGLVRPAEYEKHPSLPLPPPLPPPLPFPSTGVARVRDRGGSC